MAVFNPEDPNNVGGPRCRNCHKGSSGCGGCHNDGSEGVATANAALQADDSRNAVTFLFAAMYNMGYANLAGSPYQAGYAAPAAFPTFFPYTGFKFSTTSEGATTVTPTPDTINPIDMALSGGGAGSGPFAPTKILKNPRTVAWSTAWRTNAAPNNPKCADDGLSWPHRTLGWKMLKDDLFGIDVTGRTDGQSTVIGPGQTRSMTASEDVSSVSTATINTQSSVMSGAKAHDLDSVCLDCHNPTIWNVSLNPSQVGGDVSHQGDATTNAHVSPRDNMNDELLLRGLP